MTASTAPPAEPALSRGPLAVLAALRPGQWVKNLLLLVPLIASHRLTEAGLWIIMVAAVASFSLCASAVYLLNDLFDLPADRQHPTKRYRPLASGRVSPVTAWMLILVLPCLGLGLALWRTPADFVVMLAAYLMLTTLYTFQLKRLVLVDVIALAGLYTLRILAGGAAVDIFPSPWLLAFSVFLFLSLAFAKRFAELLALQQADRLAAPGRGYMVIDLDLLRVVGPISGYLAVLVLCLYINSEMVVTLYRRPLALWFACPVLLYWLTRVWLLAGRGRLGQDPVLFATTDPISYLCALTGGVVLIAASV